MRGWSFCIVTAPNNEEVLEECIRSIQAEFNGISNYEIIVIGTPNITDKNLLKNTRIIPFDEEVFSLKLSNIIRVIKQKSLKRFFFRTGAICHKKNLAAKNAKYDKLCIMHDYVGIQSGWREGFEEFGEDWEVSMNIILNKDNSRYRDWMCWDHPEVGGACLMPYDEYNRYMYISGTYLCVKKDFFLDNPLDEKRFWGEGEDVEWSLRVRNKTSFRMNVHSSVKFIKLKPLEGAPYCESWKRNEEKLVNILKKNRSSI